MLVCGNVLNVSDIYKQRWGDVPTFVRVLSCDTGIYVVRS